MANIFEPVATKLLELGVLDIFIFIIVAAVFYALLKKSKILGGTPAVDGVVAISIAFFVFLFRWITGFSLTEPFSMLFTQATAVLLLFVFGLMAASMFYPDMMKWLPQVFGGSRSMLTIMIVLGLALVISSGLITVFWASSTAPAAPGEVGPPMDLILIAVGLIIFIVVIIIAASVGGK